MNDSTILANLLRRTAADESGPTKNLLIAAATAIDLLNADSQRLDWLEAEAHIFRPDEDGFLVVRGEDGEPFKRETIREAIDDASKPEPVPAQSGPEW
jgi:hypothetical protein